MNGKCECINGCTGKLCQFCPGKYISFILSLKHYFLNFYLIWINPKVKIFLKLDPCASNPCKNGGTCKPCKNIYLCPEGWKCNCPANCKGRTCEVCKQPTPSMA